MNDKLFEDQAAGETGTLKSTVLVGSVSGDGGGAGPESFPDDWTILRRRTPKDYRPIDRVKVDGIWHALELMRDPSVKAVTDCFYSGARRRKTEWIGSGRYAPLDLDQKFLDRAGLRIEDVIARLREDNRIGFILEKGPGSWHGCVMLESGTTDPQIHTATRKYLCDRYAHDPGCCDQVDYYRQCPPQSPIMWLSMVGSPVPLKPPSLAADRPVSDKECTIEDSVLFPGEIEEEAIRILRESDPSIQGSEGGLALFNAMKDVALMFHRRDFPWDIELLVSLTDKHFNVEPLCQPTWPSGELWRRAVTIKGFSQRWKRGVSETKRRGKSRAKPGALTRAECLERARAAKARKKNDPYPTEKRLTEQSDDEGIGLLFLLDADLEETPKRWRDEKTVKELPEPTADRPVSDKECTIEDRHMSVITSLRQIDPSQFMEHDQLLDSLARVMTLVAEQKARRHDALGWSDHGRE